MKNVIISLLFLLLAVILSCRKGQVDTCPGIGQAGAAEAQFFDIVLYHKFIFSAITDSLGQALPQFNCVLEDTLFFRAYPGTMNGLRILYGSRSCGHPANDGLSGSDSMSG
jgi:hypothetical protein